VAGFSDIIRNGIAIANSLTGTLQVTVKHSAWVSVDVYGKPVYAVAIERQAIVDFKQRLMRSFAGAEVLQTASVMFLEPIDSNGAEGRREPIDPRDKIVLPNGHTGVIIDVKGFVDVSTDHPFYYEVALGSAIGGSAS
jgi:hypothetical protein